MRFEPIKTLPMFCPNFREEGYDTLVKEIGVYSWSWTQPFMASELERFLILGTSHKRKSDFFELNVTHGTYNKLAVFDHAICFKAYLGPFVMTMPYGSYDGFYCNFNAFADAYYRDKARIADITKSGVSKMYAAENWHNQLFRWNERRMMAAIVPDRFKVRTNGDFAAIIASEVLVLEAVRDLFGITSDNEVFNE